MMNTRVNDMAKSHAVDTESSKGGIIRHVAYESFLAGFNAAMSWRRGVEINEKAYRELINQNIEALNKYFPEHSLEKTHIKTIMEYSVWILYGDILNYKYTPK